MTTFPDAYEPRTRDRAYQATIRDFAAKGEAQRRTIARLENENHAIREELNETRRDRDDLQAQLEDVRYIQRTLTPVEYQ